MHMAGLRERGVVIVWLALFMLLMLCFVAIGIDVAKLHTVRTQLQNAADAAALAGASAIDPNTGTIIAARAIARAQETGANNRAFVNGEQAVTVSAEDVIVGPTTCTVKTRREGDQSIVTHFAQVLGIPILQMTATATAKVDTARGVGCGIVPLAAVPIPGETFEYGCDKVYQLKLGAGGGVGGNYGVVQLPQCYLGPCGGMSSSGANTYRCLLEEEYCCEIDLGDFLKTEPGNMAGPTRQGIDLRFADDAVRTVDTPGKPFCYSQYLDAGGTGQRVITVPIVSALPNGSASVKVTGFAQFFLRNKAGSGTDCVLTGEFVRGLVPGVGSGGGSGAVTFTVRLVQ